MEATDEAGVFADFFMLLPFGFFKFKKRVIKICLYLSARRSANVSMMMPSIM